MNREELAWAAGFFDGEGTVTYHSGGPRNHLKNVKVSISQSGVRGKELLERFSRAVGGMGNVYGPYTPNVMSSFQKSEWHQLDITGFTKCQAVAALLWSWLGEVKREQFKRTLIQWKTDRGY